MKGSKNTAADGLSRRPPQPEDSDHQDDTDIDDFIALELNVLDIRKIEDNNENLSSQVSSFQSGRNPPRRKLPRGSASIPADNPRFPRKPRFLVLNPSWIQGRSTKGLEDIDHVVVYPSRENKVHASPLWVSAGELQPVKSLARDRMSDMESRAASSSRESQQVASEEVDNPDTSLDPLTRKYGEYYQNIARYLTTLQRPDGMDRVRFRALQREALKFSVRNRQLWRNKDKSHLPRLVLDDPADKDAVIKELHDRTGHAGRENTFARISNRYYWAGSYDDIRRYVASCEPCQKKLKNRQEEALYPSRSAPLFHRLAIDCVAFKECRGKNKLVVARCDFSGWAEATAMKNPTAAMIAKWVFEDIICRHGLVGEMKVDGGPEFRGPFLAALEKYAIHRLVISPYNAKGNGGIERGHQAFIAALKTLTDGGKLGWVDFIPWVLFADRTTIHGPTGYTPFYMVYGREAVLPIETKYPTWRTLGWDKVLDRETLLLYRTRQIMMRNEDLEESRLRKDRRRREGKEYFDNHHQIRKEPLKVGDLVLVYDIQHMDVDKSSSTKLMWRWSGPYRVREANQLKGYYFLEELDGTLIRRSY